MKLPRTSESIFSAERLFGSKNCEIKMIQDRHSLYV